jgi:hypothetical protein
MGKSLRTNHQRTLMNNEDLQKLANIAAVKNHILNILNTGRGVVPKPQLHKLQQEGMKLDRMFVDLLSSTMPVDEDDAAEISKRLKEEKAKLETKKVVKRKAATSNETDK